MATSGKGGKSVSTVKPATPAGSGQSKPDQNTVKATEPFIIKDCALISIATGVAAQNLRELGMMLETIHKGCIYFHFWGGLLRPKFDDPEYRNDFAFWARHGLHDHKLAERLALVDPTEHETLEELRRELIEIIEERIFEAKYIPWAKAEEAFQFTRSQIVVFDTGVRLSDPQDLVELIPNLPASSIFFHFIDARRREPRNMDDFSWWLTSSFDGRYAKLIWHLAALDPYFGSLTELREQLTCLFAEFL